MKNRRKYIVYLLVLIFVSVYSSKLEESTVSLLPKKDSLVKQDSLLTSDFNRQWQQKINSGGEDLAHLYTENAVKVRPDGTLLEGQDQISDYYSAKAFQIDSISTVNSIVAVLDSTTVYEIGRFQTSRKKKYAHLILWRESNGRLLRELELMAPKQNVKSQKTQIDKARAQWMDLCNAHNAEKLVSAFYADSALYYNHRPIIIGQKAITAEYGYMNSPNYRLTLNPSIFEMVNDSLAFEIGQCSGSYPGNYVLVWQKGKDGEWRIFFDSNI